MALDYGVCAREIFSCLGGRENLVSAAHCATRLRLVTVDNSKIDIKALENVNGVKGVFSSNGQLQIILGTGTVNKVYDEFLAVTGMTAATKDEVKAAAAAKQPLPKRMIKSLGDVFVPILPAIVASGLMMGLVEALGHAIPSFAGSDWYGFLDLVSATAFAYLPVLIAISAARVFGGNIFLGGVIGLCMIHSSLINAWSVASYEGAIPTWHLLFFDVQQVGYQGHVIPVIIAVWLMCFLEKRLHKIVPETIDLFVTPLVTVLTTVFLTFTIIGPIFSTAETYVLNFAQWLITVGFGVGSLIMGAIYPLTVVCGLHHMYNIIEAGLLAGEGGMNIWMPIASAANFAQCGACLAVALKSRNPKNKTIAIPSALSAALGITEPAIFGVNLRFVKPLVCGMIGGAIGAMFGAFMGIGANAYGVTGIPGFLIVDSAKLLPYAILLVISGGIAFVLTWAVWKEDVPETAKEAPAQPESPAVPALQCQPGAVYAPVAGAVIPSEEIPDGTFAAGVLGRGVGIQPAEGIVLAPFDGEIDWFQGYADGSVSRGELYNADPASGDARQCGTTASLCGIEKAGFEQDPQAMERAVRFDLTLHAMMFMQTGVPLLYSGDEIAQVNDYSYKDDPKKAGDSRYLHHGKLRWDLAEHANDLSTPEGQVFCGINALCALRKTNPAFCSSADVWTLDTGDNGILAIGRYHEGQKIIGVFNFTGEEKPVAFPWEEGEFFDLFTGEKYTLGNLCVPSCGFYYLEQTQISE